MATVAYNPTKDPYYQKPNSQIARGGVTITPSDTTDFSSYVVAVVVATGNISCVPVDGDDSSPIVITGAPVGWVLPWQLRRVMSTGTTATLASIDKVYFV